MNYSQKQLDIINATMDILNSGKELNKITVKEIADYAGIGKGSVYDHFKSKEELISLAIIKNFTDGFLEVDKIIKKDISFKEKIYSLYNLLILDIKSKSSLSILNLISTAKSFDDIKCIFPKNEFSPLNKLKESLQSLLIQGVYEKVILMPTDVIYTEMAIFANLSSLSRFITASHLGFENHDEHLIKESAYKLLIKSLS